MMKEAKRLLESRLRLSGWLMPNQARKSIKRQLLDDWTFEISWRSVRKKKNSTTNLRRRIWWPSSVLKGA
jgi:hypothetical protein